MSKTYRDMQRRISIEKHVIPRGSNENAENYRQKIIKQELDELAELDVISAWVDYQEHDGDTH